ncbi:MAG TPA: PP2C family protein-serine/threonine phosphatase [Candidatus Baltobacteraceae bacterium]|nr:PP2C family protein-serine/threonine phosphatase [Candidatus Baltobacteraceae bacterium]
MFVDWYRSYSAAIQQAIRGRVMALDAQTNRLFFILSLTALAAMLLIGGAILYYGRRHAMLALQVEREHSIVVTLQRAFSSRFETLPKASLGTAYLSATKEADVGGDLFDARRIDDARGYLLIADVSGKGFDAAVDTALIRYCMRGLCQCMRDPGEMLAALNTVFMSSRTDEDSFVVAFLGVFNSRTLSFKYSSAGHAPAYLRRQGRVEALHVTGPILGLAADETFATKTIRLQDGDTIVLATDGLTEARNEQHKMLTDDGAMRWIAESRGTSPQELIDEIVARLQRYVEGEVKDDLALLALRVEGDAVAEASEVLADFEPVATAEVSAVEGDAGPEGTPRRPPDIQYPPAGYNLLDYA